ncbi:antA/AntB antirepressor family protein [Deinococcus radiopugnans]|uniref:antA/AntB antirepressor family protein n=1 Tax=Deinococcus radiopugnans TaxID=57497 RepID=UPI0006908CA0|nr:antA/AntB antirepressor family protein [Deinococcus radiopugnans]
MTKTLEERAVIGMGNLIPIRLERDLLWIDARTLHLALGAAARFNDWITRRLADTLASEGDDFYSELSKTPDGGRPSVQYHLALDLAKEIAMLERTERGKAIRRYFIDAERTLRQSQSIPTEVPPPALPSDPLELLALSLAGLQQHRAQLAAIEVRLDTAPIRANSQMRARIYAACQAFARVHPRGYSGAYRAFKEAFGFAGAPLAAYDDLPHNRFDEALNWLDLQTRTFSAQRPLLDESA